MLVNQVEKIQKFKQNSLGIELVNKGHQFGYQNFSKKQIKPYNFM